VQTRSMATRRPWSTTGRMETSTSGGGGWTNASGRLAGESAILAAGDAHSTPPLPVSAFVSQAEALQLSPRDFLEPDGYAGPGAGAGGSAQDTATCELGPPPPGRGTRMGCRRRAAPIRSPPLPPTPLLSPPPGDGHGHRFYAAANGDDDEEEEEEEEEGEDPAAAMFSSPHPTTPAAATTAAFAVSSSSSSSVFSASRSSIPGLALGGGGGSAHKTPSPSGGCGGRRRR
jgi:hypothetical protein